MARRKKNPPYERPAPFTEQFTISPEQAERIRTNQPTGQMVGTPMRFVATESLANSGKCREVHKKKTSANPIQPVVAKP